MNGGDQQIALEDAEPAFNVGQTLVALDDLGGAEVRNIGQQHELAVEALGGCDGGFVNGVAEAVGCVVGSNEARQFGITDGLLETTLGAAIARFTAPLGYPFILCAELGNELLT